MPCLRCLRPFRSRSGQAEMPRLNILDLHPEMLDEIISHLLPAHDPLGISGELRHRKDRLRSSHGDLYNLAMTCRGLRPAARKWLLFEPESVSHYAAVRRCLRKQDGTVDPAFLRNIRRGSIRHGESLEQARTWTFLASCPKLEHLHCDLGSNWHGSDTLDLLIDGLNSLRSLRALELSCARAFTTSDTARVAVATGARLITLTSLRLNGLDGFALTPSSLESLHSLRVLELENLGGALGFLKAIPATLNRLSHLAITNCRLKSDVLGGISSTSIESLHLCIIADGFPWGHDLSSLSAFPRLRHLGWAIAEYDDVPGARPAWSSVSSDRLTTCALGTLPQQITSLAWLRPFAFDTQEFRQRLADPSFLPRLTRCSFGLSHVASTAKDLWLVHTEPAHMDYLAGSLCPAHLESAIRLVYAALAQRGIFASPADFLLLLEGVRQDVLAEREQRSSGHYGLTANACSATRCFCQGTRWQCSVRAAAARAPRIAYEIYEEANPAYSEASAGQTHELEDGGSESVDEEASVEAESLEDEALVSDRDDEDANEGGEVDEWAEGDWCLGDDDLCEDGCDCR